jgi:hypothetical protein
MSLLSAIVYLDDDEVVFVVVVGCAHRPSGGPVFHRCAVLEQSNMGLFIR